MAWMIRDATRLAAAREVHLGLDLAVLRDRQPLLGEPLFDLVTPIPIREPRVIPVVVDEGRILLAEHRVEEALQEVVVEERLYRVLAGGAADKRQVLGDGHLPVD